MTLKAKSKALIAALSIAVLSGCAQMPLDQGYAGQGYGARGYERAPMGSEMSVRHGVIEQARWVRLQSAPTGAGVVGGAILGGLLGSTIGHGNGSVAGAAVGAVAGGYAGNALEARSSGSQGVELTVRLRDGSVFAIVQADRGEGFRPGDRVRVLGSGSQIRVSRN